MARHGENMKSKSCGNCMWFIKWKADKIGGGLCDFLDKRTKTDHGKNCPDWKGIKYNRTANTFKMEIEGL